MYRKYNSLFGISSSGLGVGDAPRSALCLLAWRGACLGLGPTRRTNGLVVGADGTGIDGLQGGRDPTRRDGERCSVES